MKRPLTMKQAAQRVRDLADLADEMLEGEDKRHWNESNSFGDTGDPQRKCSDCRVIDRAREAADQLDLEGARLPVRRHGSGRAI